MSTTSSSTTSTPCYVFRLVSFDEQGNKVQKRKYGFTAKSCDASQLDETVFNGIISRAEQAFNLRPSSYSLYLVLGPGPYTTELGETDLHLDDYPALSSHSWTAFHTYTQFHHKRNQIANLTADKKGRKVVNLCLVKTTLHDVAKNRKVKLAMEKGKGREEADKDKEKSTVVEEDNTALPAGEVDGSTSVKDDMEAPPTPPKEAVEDKDNQDGLSNTSSTNVRSTSPVGQDIADLVSRFANFIAPLPVPHVTGTGSTASFGNHPGMEFIKRAADFIAPPPSLTSAAPSDGTPAVMSPCAYTHPASWDADYISGWRKHASASISQKNHSPTSSYSYKPYVPPGRRDTSPSSPAAKEADTKNKSQPQSPADKAMKDALASAQRAKLLADKMKRDALLRAQKAKFDADTIAKLDALVSYPFAGKTSHTPTFTSRSTTVDISDEEVEEGEREDNAHAFSSVSCGPAARPESTSPSTPIKTPSVASSTVETAHKYASLKSSFDKFVNDFNANLADAFGGPVPELTPSIPGVKTNVEVEKHADNTVFEAEGQKEPDVTNVRENNRARNGGLPSHNATCDICDQWITGTRYKCFTCPDWDCCEKCYPRIDQQHPGHALAALHEPTDLIRRRDGSTGFFTSSFYEINPSSRHFAIHCDGCKKPITGIRYKCAHSTCPDFDLCSNCEADPSNYATNKKLGNHSFRDHLLVKIRKPIASNSSANGGFSRFSNSVINANRIQLDRAIDGVRRAFPSLTTTTVNSGSASPERSTSATSVNDEKTHTPEVERGTTNVKKEEELKDDSKTLIIDVPLPFAIQGGTKDIHLTFDIGKNEKGETVIISNSKDGDTRAFDEVIKDAIMKEVNALAVGKQDKEQKAATVKHEEEEKKNVDKPATAPAVAQQQSQMKDARLEYDARWINDVTYNDGESVFPGTVFNKIWSVENTGCKTWPEGTKLICVSGFGKDLATQTVGRQEASYKVKSAKIGEKVNIVAENITAPEISGKFMSYYRFVAPDGTRFGDRLWIDIIVEEDNKSAISASSSSSTPPLNKSGSSLDSSRMVTPTLKVRGSTIASRMNNSTSDGVDNNVPESTDTATTYSEAITSPRSTESDLPDIDVTSSLDEEEDCDFVLLSDDDEYDQV